MGSLVLVSVVVSFINLGKFRITLEEGPNERLSGLDWPVALWLYKLR